MASQNFVTRPGSQFVQSGTGAVERTVESKLQDVVSVKDFGAVGDGVTDDTEVIQAAIDYLDSVGGGVLTFPQGVYGITDTLFVKDNIKLQGRGRPEIKAIAAIVGAMIQFGYTTGIATDPPTNPCTNAELNGFLINADYKVTTFIWSVSPGLNSGVVYVWKDSPYNRIVNCEIKSAECGLVDVEDGADFFELRNCEIHDITSTSSATQFQNLVNVDGPVNGLIENNHIYDLKITGYSPVSWGYAIRLHATDTTTVRNNWLDSGYHNLLIDGRGNLITGNRLTNGTRSNITLYQNEFFCRYNTVVGNYCDTSTGGIQEDDAGFVGRVSDNYIAFNTIRNVSFNILTEDQNTTTFQNNVFNTSGVLFPELTTLRLDKDSTVDSLSTLTAGTWTPSLINNTNNTSGTAISDAQYMRVGNVVSVAGVATTTLAASGTYEFRFTPPISSLFDSAADAAGTANDNFSTYGNFAALTTGSPRYIRVQGTAANSGNKTIRFTGSYIIK